MSGPGVWGISEKSIYMKNSPSTSKPSQKINYLDLFFVIFDAKTISIKSPPPTLVFLRFCRLLWVSLCKPTPTLPDELRGPDAGIGLRGGFADVTMKLLHVKVEDAIEEHDDDVAEAA